MLHIYVSVKIYRMGLAVGSFINHWKVGRHEKWLSRTRI